MAEKKNKTTKEIADKSTDDSETINQELIKKNALAKSGKRSAKSIKESEIKKEKEEKKLAKIDNTEESKKISQKPPREKTERKGKKYKEAFKSIDRSRNYEFKEGLDLAIKTSTTKFDATVELHARLGVDPKQADQNIRSVVILPEGTGKTVRVAVYGDVAEVDSAKKAGADLALGDELLQQLDKGLINFDTLITTPALMPKLAKYARLLGPKGLMPNPKNSTVTNDVSKAVKEAKAGRVEYRIDSNGIVHLGLGKVSFGSDKLMANANAVLSSLKSNKPATLKGNYVKSIYLSTTMGPSVPVDKSSL